MIDLTVENRTKERAFSRTFFVRVATATEAYLGIPEGHTAEISIVLIGPRAMRALNKQRRGHDAPTDVLSFPLHQTPIPSYTTVLFGDLFICPAVVREKAILWGRDAEEQMAWTIVHGLLHCAGFDHEQGVSEAEHMAAVEQRILNHLKNE